MCTHPPNTGPNVTELMIRLDMFTRPGISERAFRILFAKCQCGLVMTHRMFTFHECAGDSHHLEGDVVDLTSDETVI